MTHENHTNENHIAKAFDNDLAAIENLVIKMGEQVAQQIAAAAQLLISQDLEQAKKIRANDKPIDKLQEKIEHHVVRLIALRQPKAQDLRAALAAMKVAADLERIGDYAKNIAKRTNILAQLASVSGTAKQMQQMAMQVRQMVIDVLAAYQAKDIAKAKKVRSSDEEIDKIHTKIFRELLDGMLENKTIITPAMHLLFISKNIERMGDHITSIAEQIIFQATGESPEEARPKGDKTSTSL